MSYARPSQCSRGSCSPRTARSVAQVQRRTLGWTRATRLEIRRPTRRGQVLELAGPPVQRIRAPARCRGCRTPTRRPLMSTFAAPRMVRGLAALLVLSLPAALAAPAAAQTANDTFTLEQVQSYPFPSELIAAPTGSRVAWVFDERGVRNIWVAEAPDWKARRVTGYAADDGQELTNLAFSPDGNTIVYFRGGDHDANWR